jgi:hypothetical protein
MPETDLPERDWRLAGRVSKIESRLDDPNKRDEVRALKVEIKRLERQLSNFSRICVVQWRKDGRRIDEIEKQLSIQVPLEYAPNPDAEEIAKGQTFIEGYNETS